MPLGATRFLIEAAASPAHVQCVPHVHVSLTQQQRFDQAPMQTAHGVAHCLTNACQRLQEQRNEPLVDDSLVVVCTLRRHFANNMRVPLKDCSDLLMQCTPFSPHVPYNHLGRLHEAVRVVDNAWEDDGGRAMPNESVALMEEADVTPGYTRHLSLQGHARGDPNDSTSSAVPQGHGAPVLSAHNHPSAECNDPTSSASKQGHVSPARAQSMGSYAMLTPAGVLSPQGPPRGALTDSTAVATAQGHGEPPHIPQGHPRGDQNDSTASATTQGHRAPLHRP